MIYHYFWWIPLLGCLCAWNVWLSWQVNKNPNTWLFFLMWLPLNVWPFVSKISTDLLFDGLLYDILMCMFYAIGFIIVGMGKELNFVNYSGILLIFLGFILMKA